MLITGVLIHSLVTFSQSEPPAFVPWQEVGGVNPHEHENYLHRLKAGIKLITLEATAMFRTKDAGVGMRANQ